VTLYIHGMGHFHPEPAITNKFLEELDIGTNDEWIVDRVGIRERRSALSLDYIKTTKNRDVRAAVEALEFTNAQLAARAAELAIVRAGIDKRQIGLVISGSSAPRVLCPAEACFVSKELGIEALSVDLSSACSTFLVQLHHLSLMDPTKLPEFVLIAQAEQLTSVIDYSDRSSAVLFGDGAAAAVVSTRVPSRVRALHCDATSSPDGADKVLVKRTEYFQQDGRAVQMFAIRRTREGYEKLVEARAEESSESRPLYFVGHQANLRVLDQVVQRCGVTPDRHFSNVEWFGNTGGASCPSVISMHWDKIPPGSDVAAVVVGGGLTWARSLLRFEAEA
jgi:3-oxoacyl-[acyl-carrier-protein] synthase-3